MHGTLHTYSGEWFIGDFRINGISHTFTWDDHPTWQRVCTCLYGTHMSRIRKIRRIYIPMKSFVVSVLRMCISHMAAWKKISTQICNTCQSIRVDGKWFTHVGIGDGHECMCLWFTKCGEWFCYCEHYRHVIDMLSTTLCVYISMAHKNPLFPCDIWIWSCLITFTVPHCYHVVDVQTMVYTHITGMFLRNKIQRIPRHWNLCRC